MPNQRIPRSRYQAQVGKTPLQGFTAKVLHILARNMPFPRSRVALYRAMGARVARDVSIGLDSYLDDQFAMAMTLQDGCTLGARATIVVHDDEGLSAGGPGSIFKKDTMILGHVGPVSVERGAVVGARAILMPGVIVSEKSVIWPGSVVTRDVLPGAVVAGAPAKPLGPGQDEHKHKESGVSTLPRNYILRQEYDARVHKSWLRLAYQYVLLTLARFTLPTRLRVALYRAMGARIGKDVYIGVDTYLDERYPELITMEDDSGPSFRSTFITHGEAYDEEGNRISFVAPILIKKGSWPGSNTVICPGVTVGEGAIVGSGSVVTEDVPDNAVVVGNPARVIKYKQLPPTKDSA
jgi:acetyltransferase-like isoleucine patch superfamily enzyme